MAGIAKLKKDELKLVAEEIGLAVTESMKKSEIRRLIEESEVFINDNETVQDAIDQVLEEKKNQKSDQDGQIELERLKLERIKVELELAQLKANNTGISFDHGRKNETEVSMEVLIKSI
ncbi:hypothetical protein AVEN_201919-1 [Araneus ventricosus]|uniref:Rho termination factor N-terminal domain-containing protein n=1 Tax=Araneus ventricosus TaxID=182803 RepID=A0A4Y2U087_ARAVE|nr:hypothetical protein AVEN_201919-1 [Araneus ventricosus]